MGALFLICRKREQRNLDISTLTKMIKLENDMVGIQTLVMYESKAHGISKSVL